MRAILFAVNGTLFDSHEQLFWRFEQLTKEFNGAPASRMEIARAMDGTVDDALRKLVPSSKASFQAVKSRHEILHEQSLTRVRLFEGVTELLPILRRIGFRIAAVVSGDNHMAETLETTDIRRFFDVVVDDQDAAHTKPQADGLLRALKHLSVKPGQAIVVGNHEADIAAGKRAGAEKTIGVLHGFAAPDMLRAAGADHIVQDIPSLLDVVE